MPDIPLSKRQEASLLRLQEKLRQIKAEVDEIGFVLQGSVTERWKRCGKPSCRCHDDPNEWHGPYYQLSWKKGGRTSSVVLSWKQAALCRQWVKNNRKLENIIKRLRELSLRAAKIYEIHKN